MKYKVTLNGRTYVVEVVAGKAQRLAEYEAVSVAPAAAPAAAPVVTGAGEAVNAPMPGTSLKANVE